MKPESIPISELAIPDSVPLPKLSSEDAYRLLATKVLRGRLTGGVLFAVSLAGLVGTLIIFRSAPWAVASGLGCALFGFAFHRSRQKLDLARRIATEPQLVYWAHPTVLRQEVTGGAIDINFITLHSRDGVAFEVGMSREEMVSVVAWLRQHNPDIRLGSYENRGGTSNGHNT